MKKLLSFLLVFLMVFSILPTQSLGQGFINDLFGKIEEKNPSSAQEESPPLKSISSSFATFTDEQSRYLFHNIPFGISSEDFRTHGLDPLSANLPSPSSDYINLYDDSFPFITDYSIGELLFDIVFFTFDEKGLEDVSLNQFFSFSSTPTKEDFLPFYINYQYFIKNYYPLMKASSLFPPMILEEDKEEGNIFFENFPYLDISFSSGVLVFSEEGFVQSNLFNLIANEENPLTDQKEEVILLVAFLYNRLTENYGPLTGAQLVVSPQKNHFQVFSPPVTKEGAFHPEGFSFILDSFPPGGDYSLDFYWNNVSFSFRSYFNQEEGIPQIYMKIQHLSLPYSPIPYQLLPPFMEQV